MIPELYKKQYKVYFYHKVNRGILCYKFASLTRAEAFFARLDKAQASPTMYVSERIR